MKNTLAIFLVLIVALAMFGQLLFPNLTGDPVFRRALSETKGNQKAAIRSMGYVSSNEDGDFEIVALHRTIARRRGPSLKMNNGVLKALSQYKTIRMLSINGPNHINDDGMPYIAELVNLEKLSLFHLSLSDHGLQQLQTLKNLRSLTINTDSLSDQAISRFKSALPNCQIRQLDNQGHVRQLNTSTVIRPTRLSDLSISR